MSETFRIHFKLHDFEFEVESHSQDFVEAKYKEAMARLQATPPAPAARTPAAGAPVKRSKDSPRRPAGIDVPGYVSHIKEKPEFPTIENNVLNQTEQLPRIMLCLYYCEEFFKSPSLTSGQMETITDQLGVKVDVKNDLGSSRATKDSSHLMVSDDAALLLCTS